MKIIDAICATSRDVKRMQICINEETGIIIETGELGFAKKQVDYYYDDNCLLFAGMGDVHIHAREDVSGKNTYKEDFFTTIAAMKNGGVTHAGDMPNNPIPPVDDLSYASKFELAQAYKGCLWLYAGIGPNTRPLSYPVPYKVYMGPSIGELFFRDLESLDEALSFYKNQVVSFHCEDPEVLEAHKGCSLHHQRRPVEAESVATKDALMLIEKYNLKGKLCHYSSDEGLSLIREARSRGVEVSIEVTPQHLYFDLEHLSPEKYLDFQMNPPIRHAKDRNALLMALKNNEIQFLATDHAPHTIEEKKKGTSGLTGLDTYAGFVTWLLAEGISAQTIAKVAAENPGDFRNQFQSSWEKWISPKCKNSLGYGYLKSGYMASFTVLNTNSPQLVTKEFLKTKVNHSPFLGVTFPGKLEALFIEGIKI